MNQRDFLFTTAGVLSVLAGVVLSHCTNTPQPITALVCQANLVVPFIGRKPDEVTVGEIRLLISSATACANHELPSDPFGIDNPDGGT
jgi:hypothetical protein